MGLGSEIRDPGWVKIRIRDPGVKKAPDPWSGSAILSPNPDFYQFRIPDLWSRIQQYKNMVGEGGNKLLPYRIRIQLIRIHNTGTVNYLVLVTPIIFFFR
jgi:hypothetical protein